MGRESKHDAVAATMRRINQVWLDGHVEALAALVDPEIVMVPPGFSERTQGREGFLASFRDFCQSATIHQFHHYDERIDVAADTAVVTFRFDMIYQRSGESYYSTGRDLWVFQNRGGNWIAVWRTMLDLEERPD